MRRHTALSTTDLPAGGRTGLIEPVEIKGKTTPDKSLQTKLICTVSMCLVPQSIIPIARKTWQVGRYAK